MIIRNQSCELQQSNYKDAIHSRVAKVELKTLLVGLKNYSEHPKQHFFICWWNTFRTLSDIFHIYVCSIPHYTTSATQLPIEATLCFCKTLRFCLNIFLLRFIKDKSMRRIHANIQDFYKFCFKKNFAPYVVVSPLQ